MEHFTLAHYNLVANIYSTPKMRHNVTEEVFSGLLLLVEKEMAKLSFKRAEQVRKKRESCARGQLFQEYVFVHYFSVLIQNLVRYVKSHCIVKSVRHSLSLNNPVYLV